MSKKDKKSIITLECGIKVTDFNLKKALRGDDVVCRNGSGVGQLTRFVLDDNGAKPLYGVTKGDDDITDWHDNGIFEGNKHASGWDLFMLYKEKPKKDKKVKNKDDKKTKRWCNVYRINPCEGGDLEVSNSFESKKEAKLGVPDYAKEDGSYIKTIKIKF